MNRDQGMEPREAFFLCISGDDPLAIVVDGRDALRSELSQQFFGEDGPETPECRDEEQRRWRACCEELDDDDGPPSYRESGEDYVLQVVRLTAFPLNLEREGGDSTPPATPVEPPDPLRLAAATLAAEVLASKQNVGHYLRSLAKDVKWCASHPPAVSGEGEIEERADAWLKRSVLAKLAPEDSYPTAVERAVYRVLNSSTGESRQQRMVELVRAVATPTGAPR